MASLLNRRTPLADLSTSSKTCIPRDAINKKGIFSKASRKAMTAGRKALSDISNTGRSFNGKATKKTNKRSNNRKQLSKLIQEPIEVHDHQKCIEAQCRDTAFDIDMDELLHSFGLHKECSEKLATPFSSPPLLFGEEWGKLRFGYPSPCTTPELSELDPDWLEDVNFELTENPEFDSPSP